MFFDRSKTPKRSRQYLFDCEALIIAGEGAEFRPKKFNGKFDLHQRAYAIHGFGDQLLGDYLYYYLEHVHEYFQRVAVGATVKSLRQRHFDNLPVIVPPLEEQQRIVAVLDDAFAAIATATANAEKNLANARELFESCVRQAFADGLAPSSFEEFRVEHLAARHKGSMRTGPFGSQLLHSEFVDAGVSVLGIDNAVANEFRWGKRRFITEEKFSALSRFLVHPGDVIITIMGTCGRCAVIPHDIPQAINSKHLFCISLDQKRCLPSYLHAYFLYAPDARTYLEERSKGSIMAGLNMGIIKEMPVRLPSLEQQGEIVDAVDEAKQLTDELERIYEAKLIQYTSLKHSILHRAFSGKLTQVASSASNDNWKTPAFAAQVIALAYRRHLALGTDATFGRVKAQKALHLCESVGKVDMGRSPIKDAAGPNDFQHMLSAEDWAKVNEFFEFVQRPTGNGYGFRKLARFDAMVAEGAAALKPVQDQLDKAIALIAPMKSEQAELLATVHAAWNNLILDSVEPTEAAIIHEARENWHVAKQRFDDGKFRQAIATIRAKGIVPDGSAKRVGGQEALLF